MVVAVLVVFAIVNVLSFIAYATDKFFAKKGKWRIAEKHLLLASFFGPLGSFMAVLYIKHKSNKMLYLIQLIVVLLLSVLFWGTIFYLIF